MYVDKCLQCIHLLWKEMVLHWQIRIALFLYKRQAPAYKRKLSLYMKSLGSVKAGRKGLKILIGVKIHIKYSLSNMYWWFGYFSLSTLETSVPTGGLRKWLFQRDLQINQIV